MTGASLKSTMSHHDWRNPDRNPKYPQYCWGHPHNLVVDCISKAPRADVHPITLSKKNIPAWSMSPCRKARVMPKGSSPQVHKTWLDHQRVRFLNGSTREKVSKKKFHLVYYICIYTYIYIYIHTLHYITLHDMTLHYITYIHTFIYIQHIYICLYCIYICVCDHTYWNVTIVRFYEFGHFSTRQHLQRPHFAQGVQQLAPHPHLPPCPSSLKASSLGCVLFPEDAKCEMETPWSISNVNNSK